MKGTLAEKVLCEEVTVHELQELTDEHKELKEGTTRESENEELIKNIPAKKISTVKLQFWKCRK